MAGAGLAGLSAAVRLSSQQVDRDIVVLEATANAGGRSRSFDHGRSGYELDNGQHLMMGCDFETLAFLRTLGQDHNVEFQRNMSVDVVQPGGKRVSMRCPALPAPLHLGAGLLSMRGMGMLHKASALRAGLLLRGEVDRPDDNETCDAWLRRLGQIQPIRNAFWEPLVWATLNDDPLVSSAAMLMAVLERAFLGTRVEDGCDIRRGCVEPSSRPASTAQGGAIRSRRVQGSRHRGLRSRTPRRIHVL